MVHLILTEKLFHIRPILLFSFVTISGFAEFFLDIYTKVNSSDIYHV